MSHELKTVGHWARTKIQALEAFTEEQKQNGKVFMQSDEGWWNEFVNWLQSPATKQFEPK
jgi:hypothetical protein